MVSSSLGLHRIDSVVIAENKTSMVERVRKRMRFLDSDNMIITSFDNLVISRNRKIIFLHVLLLLRFSFPRKKEEFLTSNMKIARTKAEMKRQQIYFNLACEFVRKGRLELFRQNSSFSRISVNQEIKFFTSTNARDDFSFCSINYKNFSNISLNPFWVATNGSGRAFRVI